MGGNFYLILIVINWFDRSLHTKIISSMSIFYLFTLVHYLANGQVSFVSSDFFIFGIY